MLLKLQNAVVSFGNTYSSPFYEKLLFQTVVWMVLDYSGKRVAVVFCLLSKTYTHTHTQRKAHSQPLLLFPTHLVFFNGYAYITSITLFMFFPLSTKYVLFRNTTDFELTYCAS